MKLTAHLHISEDGDVRCKELDTWHIEELLWKLLPNPDDYGEYIMTIEKVEPPTQTD